MTHEIVPLFCLYTSLCLSFGLSFNPSLVQHHLNVNIRVQVEEKGRFREDNYQKAVAAVNDTGVEGGQDGKKQKRETGKGDTSDIFRLIKQLSEKEYHPVRSRICHRISTVIVIL